MNTTNGPYARPSAMWSKVDSPYILPVMTWDEVFARIEPDGLPASEAGPWAEEKHKLLAHYATLFVRSMRGKWGELVYLDLFSGAGAFKVRHTTRYYRSSPMIVYSLEDAFRLPG